MDLTEKIFGKNANNFSKCVEKKIGELNEKYKTILEEKQIDLIKDPSYFITYDVPQKGMISYTRTIEISSEIDSEIDKIFEECLETFLKIK